MKVPEVPALCEASVSPGPAVGGSPGSVHKKKVPLADQAAEKVLQPVAELPAQAAKQVLEVPAQAAKEVLQPLAELLPAQAATELVQPELQHVL